MIPIVLNKHKRLKLSDTLYTWQCGGTEVKSVVTNVESADNMLDPLE